MDLRWRVQIIEEEIESEKDNEQMDAKQIAESVVEKFLKNTGAALSPDDRVYLQGLIKIALNDAHSQGQIDAMNSISKQ